MNRLRQPQAEAVAEALRYIPRRFHEPIGCDVFCEDPLFAGISAHSWERHPNGASYHTTNHCLWSYHARDKRATVVLRSDTVRVAVHELGHVLHGELIQRLGGWSQHNRDSIRLEPCTEYARTSLYEAFAEAFTAYCLYQSRALDEHPYFLGFSRANEEFFFRLLRS